MMELTGKITDFGFDMHGKARITLVLNEKQTAMQAYDDLHEVEKLSVKIDKHREKRSLNANNYAWELIGKIAENQGITKDEVYLHHIREVGVSRTIEISEKAAPTITHIWNTHGKGWIVEKLDDGEHPGYVSLCLYYGSSSYNTKQMSRLIDNIVQDCKALGIETLTPEELERMKQEWKGKKNA